MQTLDAGFSQTLEEKQSKFIAHLVPYRSFDETLEALRAEHPKARHFVTAYRYLNELDQIVEGCSDDGEPRGTSGKPTLAVMQGHELINAGLVTVRYFGGTKLGTGGLVRAYGDAANLVIDAAELRPYRKEFVETGAVGYSDLGRAEYAAEQSGLIVDDKRFDAAEAVLQLRGTREALDAFWNEVGRMVRRG